MKSHYSNHFIIAWWMFFSMLVFSSTNAYSQDLLTEAMFSKKFNLENFSEPNAKVDLHMWYVKNEAFYQNHPEFGILPTDSPCTNCIEILSARTASERFFLDIADTTLFFKQTSIGEKHYWDGEYWLTIDPRLNFKAPGNYFSNYYLNPITISNIDKQSVINQNGVHIAFNNWQLYKKDKLQTLFLFDSDWSDFSAGDDGVFVKNIFPGIDAELIVTKGSVKTNFIIKDMDSLGEFDELIFRDHLNTDNGEPIACRFNSNKNSQEAIDDFTIFSSTQDPLLVYHRGVSYLQLDDQKQHIDLTYRLSNNFVDIVVPDFWIKDNIHNYAIVIDPVVTGTNTLAQAAITGSMYNASCNFLNSCNYNLTVAAPANATFENVTFSFSYFAQGACWLEDGAMRFTTGSCISPSNAGFFWFCNQIGGGTCNGNNISIFNDVSSCLPAPSCVSQNVVFTLQFFRGCWGTAGCNNACIGAATPFTITIQGRTVEYNNTNSPIDVSSTSICQGQSITASTNALYGVPPLNYSWSFSPTGLPAIGTGQSVSITFPNTGAITLYSIVTDNCGNQIVASRVITVNPTPTIVASASSVNICQGQSTTLTATGGGTSYTWSNGLGNGANQTVSPNTTTTYTVSSTVSGCTGSNTITINVTPQPAAPNVACYEIANWNTTTCLWNVTGTQPPVPTVACYETATWNPTTCVWNVTGTQQPAPTVACYETATWNPTSCVWNITGTQPPAPNVACYETATWNPTTCVWNVTGTQPLAPTVACYETATWNPITCVWNITGTQPPTPTLACYETATWNPTSCVWDVTGNQPVQPTIACYETATLNNLTCMWEVSGNQPPEPNVACYETATWNPTSCVWDVTGTQPVQPTIACYETATLNNLTCMWEVSGNQPPQPNVACYETATWNPTTCMWNITGTMPIPLFSNYGPYCLGTTIPTLPTISNNGISGTWSPAINNSNTTTYTFTPNPIECAATASITIVVNQNLESISNLQICQNQTPLLWNGLSLSTNGTYTTSVSAANGCDSLVTLNLTVHPLPNVAFNASVTAGCAPIEVTFANLTNSSNICLWNFGNGTTSNQCGPVTTTYNNFGLYDVTLQVIDAIGCTATLTQDDIIFVYPQPVASFNVNPIQLSRFEPTANFTNTSIGYVSQIWDFGDGSGVSNEDSPSYTYPSEVGHYYPSLIVANEYGCLDSTSQMVVINNEIIYYIPNTFTPDQNKFNPTFLPVFTAGFDIYNYNLLIFNRWGEVVFESNNAEVGWDGTYGGKLCPDGTYIYQIYFKELDKDKRIEIRGQVNLLR